MTKKVDKVQEVKIDNEVDVLVEKGQKALQEFMELDQEKIDYIVAKACIAAIDAHGTLAKLAVEETKRGVFEDKATKNMFATEYVTNNMRNLKTVGIIHEDEVTGITQIAEPVGVVCGITPVTNPTSTAIFKSLICLKTRNPIIFSFHPSAQQCSVAAAKVVLDAAVKAGAPENCVQWIERGSKEKTDQLMKHEGVATILATGGNAMVHAAYSCGKPALGVGAGNVPAYIEKSADIAQAVNDIALSKAFDNGMICASEQAVIADKEVYKQVCDGLKKYGVYFVNKEEKAKLERFLFGVASVDENFKDAVLNPAIVGRDATWLAEQAGITVPANTSILAAECKSVGPQEVLTREKLSPVLAVIQAKDTDDGIRLSKEMVEFNGLGHSAAVHTKSKEISERFGKAVPAIRIIWNSPSTFGGIGNVYNEFIPSLTLGCGSYGHNSVGDNVSAVHLLNIKKIGRRNNNMQWFKVPQKIYFERNSIRYLTEMVDVERVFIVADQSMVNLGFTNVIIDQLNKRRDAVSIQLFTDVEPDPSIETVRKGFEMMQSFKPDTIIALGGGSPMDAAKGMWIFYEQPDIDFNDLKQKFIDIRKRAFKYPELGRKAKMVCIPTTSGTGSEVTPFAVITDKKENKKYPLADYAMVPQIAIVDPIFTTNLPASVTADTGLDVLTHATEAFVSNFASDFTDGLCVQAVKMVFEYLERAVKDGKNDLEAREKMHNASTLAGMAFGNAFLGINHSLAHKIGGRWHVPHGRINAILMPHVIRYNGTQPEKPSLWPKYNVYRANERYAELARILGLKADTVEEGVESYAKACHDLAERCGIVMNLQEQGIAVEDFEAHKEEVAYLAYEDQCSPCNPRLPIVTDMIEILNKSYYAKPKAK
ncbi:bifunctional acetaldehyde-CoA/alcohol dehydrogenase [Erysipelothrix larvae]|uniref:Aldehyde-alcohol dehydrogenase n=1 Tax=Erysipelothrix larvae TaxID=1514105 RepID=A0A0X8H0P0_9FIRM|nr:bifunctional acetaldehyde-CoA/alcohol dehydrogenase [Erysipelothrix larvae]AMC93927.1 bifunctional acetaldehyde-CoA/alcohol dehydrogenase [Erysipelothrix larvae]